MPGISPILPFLPPKRWSPSPFCRCHGSEKPPVFSRVQGINLDSTARRRLVLWYNPRSRLGKEHAIPCNPGGSARRGSGSSAPRLSPTPPSRSRLSVPRGPALLRRGRPAVAGGARRRWHLGCDPRRPPLAAGSVCVCARLCARAGGRLHIGAALAEAGLEGLALEPWICSQSLSILGTG